MRKRIFILGLLIIAAAGGGSYWLQHQETVADRPKVVIEKPVDKKPFNKNQYSLDDPNSIWLVVNKLRPLRPNNYAPSDLVTPSVPMRVSDTKLRHAAAQALESLFMAAEAAGNPLKLSSGYRSYDYQVGLYNGYVQKEGQESADAQSARPGFSEHQTGLAADVGPLRGGCNVEVCFGDTTAGKWVAQNAHTHGFIIRYPNGMTDVTGYSYEPWHIRYVGVRLATEMHRTGTQTMEEFFSLPAAPDYGAN